MDPEDIDLFDMTQEERLWPTCDEPEAYTDDEPQGSFDSSDDGDALASAGMGTDEDYGRFDGGEDDFLDGSYEE